MNVDLKKFAMNSLFRYVQSCVTQIQTSLMIDRILLSIKFEIAMW